jgi:HlyD family secretion protein
MPKGNQTMKRYLQWLGVAVVVIFVFTKCHHSTKAITTNKEVITITPQTLSHTLVYAGTIQPLKGVTVISPAEGVIEDMSFHYGDVVKTGQILFTINSEKFQTDYKTALIQYVKARSELNNNKSQLSEGDFLHTNKLISDDDFKARQTNFYNAQLSFLQAKDSLAQMLKQLDIKGINLYDLTISDITKINSALHMQGNSQKLQVISPSSGVALLPIKMDATSGSEKKMGKGEQIKQGDMLALVGDGKGISIRVGVSEFDITQIKIGQHVKITGAAFPDFTLEGSVAGVDHQAQVNSNGMPNFSAEIVVPTLSEAEQKVIYIGMSARVEINIEEAAQITVPLTAVTEKNNENYVKLLDPKSGKLSDVLVKTGKTTPNAVVILAGLKAGDKIAITH